MKRPTRLPNKEILPPIIEEAPVGEDLSNLTEYFETHLNKRQLKCVKDMAYRIGKVGMSLDEACLLARVTKDEFLLWCEEHPHLSEFLKIQALEYKFALLGINAKHAIENKDVKTASWLLEKQFSEEFDSSFKKEAAKFRRGTDEDVIAIAFAMVRQGSSQTVPVNPSVGLPQNQVIHEAEFKEIKDILQ